MGPSMVGLAPPWSCCLGLDRRSCLLLHDGGQRGAQEEETCDQETSGSARTSSYSGHISSRRNSTANLHGSTSLRAISGAYCGPRDVLRASGTANLRGSSACGISYSTSYLRSASHGHNSNASRDGGANPNVLCRDACLSDDASHHHAILHGGANLLASLITMASIPVLNLCRGRRPNVPWLASPASELLRGRACFSSLATFASAGQSFFLAKGALSAAPPIELERATSVRRMLYAVHTPCNSSEQESG